jgi:hypothetical protein
MRVDDYSGRCASLIKAGVVRGVRELVAMVSTTVRSSAADAAPP